MKNEKTTRDEQALNTKKKVIDTMMALMTDKSFDTLSVRYICKEAGISTGTFYYHFGSKDKLLQKMYKDYCLEFERSIIKKLEHLDHVEKIIMYCTYHTLNIANLSTEFVKKIYSIENKYLLSPEHRTESYMYKVFVDGQNKGIFTKEKDAYNVIDNILRIDYGIASYCIISNNYDSSAVTRELIGDYLKSLLL
ncbi:MAG: TetR/AcrR family transcriptional regulator [Bacillota bacterium]|jgi:TetR/AcrR family fatty acid metabolism transcriptional regulator|nr:TetR/AcrR family transcriptional regulator [Bacillota bacterium]